MLGPLADDPPEDVWFLGELLHHEGPLPDPPPSILGSARWVGPSLVVIGSLEAEPPRGLAWHLSVSRRNGLPFTIAERRHIRDGLLPGLPVEEVAGHHGVWHYFQALETD